MLSLFCPSLEDSGVGFGSYLKAAQQEVGELTKENNKK